MCSLLLKDLSFNIYQMEILEIAAKMSGFRCRFCKKVQVGKDREKAQTERDSHSKHRGGKKTN